jgi:hypothetical protein
VLRIHKPLALAIALVACAQQPKVENRVVPLGVDPSQIEGALPTNGLSGIAFYTFASTQIHWVDGEDAQRCVNVGSNCQSGPTVTVHIDANEDGWKVDPRNLPTYPAGIVVARVRHRGGMKTANYNFRPFPFEYFFFVYRDAADHKSKWILRETTPAGHDSVVDGPWSFLGCWDHPPATEAHAKFYDCTRMSAPPVAEGRIAKILAVTTPFSMAPAKTDFRPVDNRFSTFLLGEKAAWFSCVAGCCTLDQIVF